VSKPGPSHREGAKLMLRWQAPLLLVALAVFATGCRDTSGAAVPPPAPVVKVEPVIQKDVPVATEWVGTLVGYINAQTRARVSGHLISQNYRESPLVTS